MKKLFLTCLAALCLVSPAYADEYELVTDVSQLNDGDLVIIAAKDADKAISTTQNANNRAAAAITRTGTVITDPAADVEIFTLEGDASGWYFDTGEGYIYAASSSSNYLRTENAASENAKALITIDGANTSIVFQGSNKRNVLQFNQTSDLFSCYGSASQKAVAIYRYTELEEGAVSTPRIAMVADADNTVAITCTTEGAEVYYTVDGTTPTQASTRYEAPFVIEGATTVKAIAYAGEKASEVASMVCMPNAVATVADYLKLASSSNVKITAPVTVSYQSSDRKYTYIYDATGALQVYSSGGTTPVYAQGDVIPAGITGSCTVYQGVKQMVPDVATFAASTEKADVVATPVTVVDLNAEIADYQSSYVVVKNADFDMEAKTLTQGDAKIALYDRFNLKLDNATACNVYGIANSYNGTPQLYPVAVTGGEVVEKVAPVEFTPAGGTVDAGTLVAMTCATEGATIHYSCNGGEYQVYSAPIAINETTTVSAYADKEGMTKSDVTTAKYTVASAIQGNTASFDFTKPSTLTPAYSDEAGDVADNANTFFNVTDVTFECNGVSVTATKGKSTDARLYYQTSSGAVTYRVYNGATLTVAMPEGFEIATIDFTGSNLNNMGLSGSAATYTPAEASNVATFAATGIVQIKTIDVAFVKAGEVRVATPVIAMADNNMVTITCATEGATIHYTIDGTEPTAEATLYTAPFAITGETTVKAVAVLDGVAGQVATKVCNVNTVASIAEFLALAANYEVTITSPVTVSYQSADRKYTYIYDATAALQVYDASAKIGAYKQGDVVAAGIKGTYALYHAASQMAPVVASFSESLSQTEVVAKEVTVKDILDNAAALQSTYAVVKNADFSLTAFKLSQGDDAVTVFNRFNLELPDTDNCTVYGIVNIYDTTAQFYPVAVEGGATIEYVAEPVFSVQPGVVENGTEVAITCATEGATVYYNADDTDAWYEYNAPIVISQTTTVKAYAAKEGMADSQVVTATYTVLNGDEITATFNFADPASLNPEQPAEAATENNGTPVNDVVFTADGATFVATKGTSTDSRLWYSIGEVALRLYAGATVTVTAPEAYVIDSIEFAGAKTTGFALAGEQAGALDGGKWTGDDVKVQQVVFNVSAGCTVSTVTVNMKKGTVGVADIAADDAEAVYYDLQGRRVANPAAGLYIRLQGTKATKVLVK